MNTEIVRSFQILEIPQRSSPEVVRAAYRELVKVWHPDRFPGDHALQMRASEKLKQINHAYELICQFHLHFQAPPQNQDPRFVFVRKGIEEAKNYANWPLSKDYSKAVFDMAKRLCIEFSEAKEAVDMMNDEFHGKLDTLLRKVTLNSGQASVFTPVFLIACQFIRDILSMDGHAYCRPVCLSALRYYGLEGEEERFSAGRYVEAERGLATRVAGLTVGRLTKEFGGFSSWLRAVKANYARSFSSAPSPEDVATFISSLLLSHAPYLSRTEFAREFHS